MGETGKKLRSNIEASIEIAEKQRAQKLLKQRIELARHGAKAFQGKNTPEAAKAFMNFVKVLEMAKNVPGHDLPSHFDLKKEAMELVLITGVFWDLVRIFDNSRSAAGTRDFLKYLEKFVIFSKGMPYQALSAETLRKFVNNRRVYHRKEMKNAYKLITGRTLDTGCFVATALADVSDPATLPRLRTFRDGVLEHSRAGRAFIDWYYKNGPRLAAVTDRLPRPARVALAKALDALARVL